MSGFTELGVMDELTSAVSAMGWYLPTPVQQEAIPLMLGGGDVMCAAETGSGKTGAFCLPTLQLTWEGLAQAGGARQQSLTKCALSADDRHANSRVSLDGLQCQCHDKGGWGGGRSTFGVTSGKWYFESIVEESGGIMRVGFSTSSATLVLGTDAKSFGYGGTGKKSTNNTFDDYGEKFDVGDIIGGMLDLDQGTISFSKNGKDLGVAFTIPPEALDEPMHAAILLKNCTIRLNFTDPKYLPQGYLPLDQAQSEEQERIAARRAATAIAGNGPLCIVLSPTLELANQVADECDKFSVSMRNPSIKVCRLSGRRERREVLSELRACHVVCSTPGGLEAFARSGELELSRVRFFIIDEADQFASNNDTYSFVVGFVQKLKSQSRASRVQVCLFSATLHSPEVRSLSQEICPTAQWVDLKGADFVPQTVHHAVVKINSNTPMPDGPQPKTDGVHAKDDLKTMKAEADSERIKLLKPRLLLKIVEAHKMSQCLIFCRTRMDCENLSAFLLEAGGKKKVNTNTEKGKENQYSNVVLSGGLSPAQRARNLDLFKDGLVRFLICTDVAARGVDIPCLPYVINMTLPEKSEDYIHRIGRTGRADKMGLAISIIAEEKEKVWYHTCPSKGQDCNNTTIAHESRGQLTGGCCIWFNEAAQGAAIELRLRQTFVELEKDTYEYRGLDADALQYGKSIAQTLQGRDSIGTDTVAKIVHLDKCVQQSFWQSSALVADILAKGR